jgi:hypothetical protein
MSKTSQRAETAFYQGRAEGKKHLKKKTDPKEYPIHKEYDNPYSNIGINKQFRSAWNRGFNVGVTPPEKK